MQTSKIVNHSKEKILLYLETASIEQSCLLAFES